MKLHNISHVTIGQISLILVEGKNNRQLGITTILDLRQNKNNIINFGQRNTPIYQVSYTLEKIKFSYHFLLNTITCIKQVS